LRATKVDEGAAMGFLRGEAGADVVFDGEVEVVADFGGEVGVEVVSTEEGEEAMEEAEVHGWEEKAVKEWKSSKV
jgi:hypothetical protein